MSVLDKFRLDEKTALVTGGSKGFGEAIALAFAEAGARVCIVSRHGDECAAAAKNIAAATGQETLPMETDVSNPERVRDMMDGVLSRFGKLDILVNNAGINIRKPTNELSPNEWHQIVDVNMMGPFLCAQAILPHMKERKYGRIINIASIAGVTGVPNQGPYSASKGGLINLSRTIAMEYAKDGITCNAVCPGTFDTPLTAPVKANPVTYRERIAKIPVARWGDPRELASVILFLASDASSFMTGSVVTVDGGWTTQ